MGEIKTRICSICGNEYPLTTEYWHRNRSCKEGFNHDCKFCKNKIGGKIRQTQKILKGLSVEAGNFVPIKFRTEDVKSIKLEKEQRYKYHTYTKEGQGYRALITRECTVYKEYENFIVLDIGNYRETVHKTSLLTGADRLEVI